MQNILDFRQIVAAAQIWIGDCRGVTVIETGLIVSGVSAVVGTVAFLAGDQLAGVFSGLDGILNPNSDISM